MKHALAAGLLAVALFSTETSAFYGIGGCPKTYPKVNMPYGPTGAVSNGYYYTHFFDYSWAKSLLSQVPKGYRP